MGAFEKLVSEEEGWNMVRCKCQGPGGRNDSNMPERGSRSFLEGLSNSKEKSSRGGGFCQRGTQEIRKENVDEEGREEDGKEVEKSQATSSMYVQWEQGRKGVHTQKISQTSTCGHEKRRIDKHWKIDTTSELTVTGGRKCD